MIRIPMQSLTILDVSAAAAFIFFQKKIALLLSTEEKRKKLEVLSKENDFKRWQNWSFPFLSMVLIFLNLFFESALPVNSLFYLIIVYLTYIAFRNRRIYQMINLPEKYINREFYLGIFAVLLLAVNIFLIF